jgi:hypothetical protein
MRLKDCFFRVRGRKKKRKEKQRKKRLQQWRKRLNPSLKVRPQKMKAKGMKVC